MTNNLLDALVRTFMIILNTIWIGNMCYIAVMVGQVVQAVVKSRKDVHEDRR